MTIPRKLLAPCCYEFVSTTRRNIFTNHRENTPSLPARISYTSSTLKTIRKCSPPSRLSDDVWSSLKDLGIRKPRRSRRKARLKSDVNTTITSTVESPDRRPESISTIPDTIIANVQSLAPKLDELHAILDVLKPGIVCLSETWLNNSILDSAIDLVNYVCFRKDRVDRQGGGVCAYINSHLPCKRLLDFEVTNIESLWVSVRPFRLPRSISNILVGTVYHPLDSNAEKNYILTEHLQRNTDSFLTSHPDGLVIVTGDFNPVSTGHDVRFVKRLTGLSQIVNVLTRDTGILDWVLTNRPKEFAQPAQLPKIGHAVLIKPNTSLHTSKAVKKSVERRDLRGSSLSAFGRWITRHNWDDVYNASSAKGKFESFFTTLHNAVETYLPTRKIKVCSTDKAWVKSTIKTLVARRQHALKTHGKDSPLYVAE